MDEDDKVREELRRRQTAQVTGRIGGKGHDPHAGTVDVINQADAAVEEHMYLFSKTADGTDLIWEIDLLGDLTPDVGHGKLPPLIHMYCPFCSRPEDPRAISIDYENKRYEIERLAEPMILPNVCLMDGRTGPFRIDRLLHVQEVVRCPFIEDVEGEICGAKFTIKGSRIERVG
jgi:hypothetical protein